MSKLYRKTIYITLLILTASFISACPIKRKVPPPDAEDSLIYKDTVVGSDYQSIEDDKKTASFDNMSGLSGDEIKPGADERISEEDLNWTDASYENSEEAMELRDFKLQNIQFDFDKSDLNDAARKRLNLMSRWLEKNPGIKLRVEGHADDRGTSEYNLALGDKRANAVKKYLLLLGIDGSRITTISYGEEMPLDQGQNESAWAKNRRVHFVSF